MADPKDTSDQDPFSDSSELFESLFKEAPLEMEDKKAEPAPGVRKQVQPAPELKRKDRDPSRQPPRSKQEAPPVKPTIKGATDAGPPSRRLDFSKTGKRGARPTPPPKRPKPFEEGGDLGPLTSRAGEKQDPAILLKNKKSASKGGKGSRLLKGVLLLVLVGAGVVAAAGYLGFVDLDRYLGRLTSDEPRPVPPQAARTTPEKKPAPQIPVKPAPEKPRMKPAPPKAEAPAKEAQPQAPPSRQAVAPSVDKPAGTETPASAPAPIPLEPPVEQPTQPAVPQSELPVKPETRPAISPQAVQPQPQATPVQKNLVEAAPPAKKQTLPQEQPGQYPFSVYLGSFRSLDRTQMAVSIYERDYGISAYWVKVDLGEKGTWYRVFAGYFPSAAQAQSFFKEKNLKEGEIKQTKYSILIGEYTKREEAEETARRLSQIGYSSYTVPSPGGGIRLYSGAFYTMEGAQKQHGELASKGIKSRVVER
jgi:cell division septation protein DedD